MLEIKKINQLFSFLNIFVAAIILVYLTGFMSLCTPLGGPDYTYRVPPDDELMRTFKENREDFELLVDMALEDAHLSGISRIALDFLWRFGANTPKGRKWIAYEPDAYFPEERWNTYRKLFKKLKIEDGLSINEDAGEVKFHPLGRKVYIYSKNKLEPVYKSLDGLEKIKLNSSKLIYRKIDDCWYIYYKAGNWFLSS